jgi:hypothetical protein
MQILEQAYVTEWEAKVPEVATYYKSYYQPRREVWAMWVRRQAGYLWSDGDGYVGDSQSSSSLVVLNAHPQDKYPMYMDVVRCL